jgi:hypothetical protein
LMKAKISAAFLNMLLPISHVMRTLLNIEFVARFCGQTISPDEVKNITRVLNPCNFWRYLRLSLPHELWRRACEPWSPVCRLDG